MAYNKLKFRTGDHVESISLMHDYGRQGVITTRCHIDEKWGGNLYEIRMDDTGKVKTFKERWLKGVDEDAEKQTGKQRKTE